ncbi:hypothetical protein FH966_03075 [Lentibacillus cibarius]|uniref:Uncharacterized protein n=1 Tax=Lentibacillus cibarius TaxID=2583219 RepID=A0A549YFW2_9BACI|nr:hypothetical protein [Lentibacillus cibarius]TRM10779.1 hypothetical protein FH966_03075 [Lentibacillus cibarius]
MIFTDWVSYVAVGLMVAVLIYAVFSIYLKKPLGLFIAMGFHIVLGILSLPSIGLYVLGVAIIELIIGIIMTVKTSSKQKA